MGKKPFKTGHLGQSERDVGTIPQVKEGKGSVAQPGRAALETGRVIGSNPIASTIPK